MNRDGLILGVSAVLFGITALMLIVGIVVSPFFLAVAVPFGASAYLLRYQASGKLGDRVSREAAAGNLGGRERTAGFDPGPFGGRTADGDTARERARRTRRNRRRARGSRGPDQPTLQPSEARRILDVDAAASEDEIKSAYRRKAKEHHPDTDSGDEDQFKKVSRAYETLRE